jgi:ATP-dependent Clp protease, protease subunit
MMTGEPTIQPSTPTQPQEVYAMFAGGIDQNAVGRIFQGMSAAIQNKVASVHLLMQSTGGIVGDGICLYNFFRTLPIDLTVYNTGAVSSVAVIAYLGAKKRKVSAHAAFMVHRTYSSPQFANAVRLQSAANSAIMDDNRTEAILRQCLNLTIDQWEIHKATELWLNANDAINSGLADEVANFAPPMGAPLYTI